MSKNVEGLGGQLVLALEAAYSAIKEKYIDGVEVKEFKGKPGVTGHVPDAVIVINSSSTVYGHFAVGKWTTAGDDSVKLSEIMISAEGLKRTARDVVGTLLHEAVHGVCHSAKVQDTSRNGRYHNEAFKRTAEEMGLVVSPKSKILGHSGTTLPEDELEEVVLSITPQLTAYREIDVIRRASIGSGNREVSVRCSCPRTIRVYTSVRDQGLILCGVCGGEFE